MSLHVIPKHKNRSLILLGLLARINIHTAKGLCERKKAASWIAVHSNGWEGGINPLLYT